MDARARIAHDAADALAARLSAPDRPGALVGFDGFIDAIIRVVDQRTDMSPSGYVPIGSIAAFADRCRDAAGKSTNLELVVTEERFGGNGPLMAGALGRLGAPTTFIGAVGREDDPRSIHPLYAELQARCERVIPLVPPAHTDALEFGDGKIMLGKPASVQSITWASLVERVGLDELRAIAARASLIGVVNWVMMGGVESIWEGLATDVLPHLPPAPHTPRRLYIDLCDPAKRTDADLARALAMLRRLDALAPLTLGLNLAEALRVSRVAGCPKPRPDDPTLQSLIAPLCERLGLSCVVVHPRHGAAAATRDGACAWFAGPFTHTPRLSTGAGDHFNAGFAQAQVCGLSLEHCLCVGVGVSGAYVRDAQSPTLERLVAFLRDLPPPEQS